MSIATRLLDNLPVIGERRKVSRRVAAIVREKAADLPLPDASDVIESVETYLAIRRFVSSSEAQGDFRAHVGRRRGAA